MATHLFTLRSLSPNRYLVICGILLTFVLLVASALLWLRSAEQAYYFVVLLVFSTLVLAVIAHRRWRGEFDWFEPGTLMPLLYLVFFGFTGFRYLFYPEALHPLLQGDTRWLTLALLYITLGVIAFWLGYYSRIGVSMHQLAHRPALEYLRSQAIIRSGVVATLYVVGLAARLLMLRLGLYGYLKDPGYYAGVSYAEPLLRVQDFCGYALVLAWLDWYSHPQDNRRRLFAVFFLLSEMLWGFFSGMKADLILPLLLVAMIHTYKRKRLPLKYAAVGVMLLILVYPINGLYRQMFRSGQIEVSNPLDMISNTPALVDEVLLRFDDPNLYVESGYESTVTRASMLEYYALLVKYLDQTGAYWRGRTMWMLPALIVVPRALWPDKPVSNIGYWFAVNVYGQDPHIKSSVAITQAGDLYLQFGLPSLLVGMSLIGITFRFFYERYGRPCSNYSLFFYVLVLARLMRLDEDVTFLAAGMLRLCVILFVLSFVAFRFPRIACASREDSEETGSPAGGSMFLASP